MNTFKWEKESNGSDNSAISVYGFMIYFEECFYITSGENLIISYISTFKYCLEDKKWLNITSPNEIIETRAYSSGFEYNGYYYSACGCKSIKSRG